MSDSTEFTHKLPTWQHIDCPKPHDADGTSRYFIEGGSAYAPQVLNSGLITHDRGVRLRFWLVCSGCWNRRAVVLWLRTSRSGRRAGVEARAKPAWSIEDALRE